MPLIHHSSTLLNSLDPRPYQFPPIHIPGHEFITAGVEYTEGRAWGNTTEGFLKSRGGEVGGKEVFSAGGDGGASSGGYEAIPPIRRAWSRTKDIRRQVTRKDICAPIIRDECLSHSKTALIRLILHNHPDSLPITHGRLQHRAI